MTNYFFDFKKNYEKSQIKKIEILKNKGIENFLNTYVEIFSPSEIFAVSNSMEDEEFVRKKAIEEMEERKLKTPNHTFHFDNYYDQARDKENTKILMEENVKLPFLNVAQRDISIKEIHKLMKDQMKDRTMFIGFFSLGPLNSGFSELAVQITDSSYVLHSELMLYRNAYEKFKSCQDSKFLRFVHTQGEVDERMTSKNLKNRRIYFDLDTETGYALNTQYAGNSVGLKKPGFRITISKAVKEGWLSEHMFLMGVNGPNGRVTYFTGAFPSMCGKTSTCMVPGEKLVGDDLVFIKIIDGKARAINIESGVFGIIDDVNKIDDTTIWNVLHSDAEIIFSNVLVENGLPYWNGMGETLPESGENYSGKWWKGKKDAEGKDISPSHKNARFTVKLSSFDNLDREALESNEGVDVGGIIYGGRDSDTWPPVYESFSWNHGVMKGASIESETTAAALGKEGIRTFNAMSIMEFLSVDLGKYLQNYIEFQKKIKKVPKIFAVNYFLRDSKDKFLNDKTDKAVWLKWMELRVNNNVGMIETPIGYLPKYEDLQPLFKAVLGKEYMKEDYEKQFTIRIPELLSKVDRIMKVYSDIKTTPKEIFAELEKERKRLLDAKEKFGEYILPTKFFY